MTISFNGSVKEIKEWFYKHRSIPKPAQNFRQLRNCLISDRELRTNNQFVQLCLEVDENLLSYAGRKIQNIHNAKSEELNRSQSIDCLRSVCLKHDHSIQPIKRSNDSPPSPSVERILKEIQFVSNFRKNQVFPTLKVTKKLTRNETYPPYTKNSS